jgi:hypothetical protein
MPMTDEQIIQINHLYTYKDHEYIVTEYDPDNYLVKDKDSGNWHDAVSYVSSDPGHAEGMTFTREEDDFRAKFTPLGEDDA